MTNNWARQAAPLPCWEDGRRRLARSGLALEVGPLLGDEAAFPIDQLCARTRPRRMAFATWRECYRGKAREVVEGSRVLVAATDYGGARLLLGFVALSPGLAVRMLYVKLQFRGMGIGLALLEAAGVGEPVLVEEAEPGWRRWAEYHQLPWVER